VILVDSDVLIAHLRGVEVARDWLVHARRRTGPLAVSVVSIAEIAGGMRSGERLEVTRLLGSSHAAIGTADYLIAACAEVHGCELATLNVEHFPMFDGLEPPFAL
jgi:predicted nucleic acid-binding protein